MLNRDQADRLDLTANISQLISLFLLLKDASNNDIMKALQDQNTVYFKEIIELLKEIKNDLQDVKATR